jgi:hypothetical protein
LEAFASATALSLLLWKQSPQPGEPDERIAAENGKLTVARIRCNEKRRLADEEGC